MKEKRVYAVPYDIVEDVSKLSDEKFIEIAERVGWVWTSPERFVLQWNNLDSMYNFPDREYSEVRIIEVESCDVKRIDVTCGYREEYPNGDVFYYGGYTENGVCYKDIAAWESGEGVCYIGEHEFESGYCIGNFNYQGNTREEIIADMAEYLPNCDVKYIEQCAEYVLQECDWQCLTTLMNEIDWEEDIKESFSNGTKVIYNDKEFEPKPYEIVEYESSECINLRNEYGKYTANLMDIYRKSDKLCPHCGGPLYHEKYDNTQDHYPYFCPECDENFFECEVK